MSTCTGLPTRYKQWFRSRAPATRACRSQPPRQSSSPRKASGSRQARQACRRGGRNPNCHQCVDLFRSGIRNRRPQTRAGSGPCKPGKEPGEQEVKAITTEGCETRLTVMSETNAIYFKTGSADLDKESEPLLNTGADIAKRCPSVKFDVEGHTDNTGAKSFNQKLSEQRAKSVVDYLTARASARRALCRPDTATLVPLRRILRKRTGPKTAGSSLRSRKNSRPAALVCRPPESIPGSADHAAVAMSGSARQRQLHRQHGVMS